MFLVDAVGQVDAIEAWAAGRAFSGRFRRWLELGMPGQRTRTRTPDQARQTAARIAASPVLRLAGIECRTKAPPRTATTPRTAPPCKA